MSRMWKMKWLGAACAALAVESGLIDAACPCQAQGTRTVSQTAPEPTLAIPSPPPGYGLPAPPPPAAPAFGSPTPMIPPPAAGGIPQAIPPRAPGLPMAPTPLQPGPAYQPGDTVPPGATTTLQPLPDVSQPLDAPVGAPITGPVVEGTLPATAGAGANRFGMSPPPGTLGRTYQQRSRIHDDEKHPRHAAVDVYLPEEVDVSARGMKSKWTGKHWRLEVKDPLLPGVPHIYAIKAERKTKEGTVLSTDVRWIRLIPGRVVDLQF